MWFFKTEALRIKPFDELLEADDGLWKLATERKNERVIEYTFFIDNTYV
jgi:hypothetical protein